MKKFVRHWYHVSVYFAGAVTVLLALGNWNFTQRALLLSLIAILLHFYFIVIARVQTHSLGLVLGWGRTRNHEILDRGAGAFPIVAIGPINRQSNR